MYQHMRYFAAVAIFSLADLNSMTLADEKATGAAAIFADAKNTLSSLRKGYAFEERPLEYEKWPDRIAAIKVHNQLHAEALSGDDKARIILNALMTRQPFDELVAALEGEDAEQKLAFFKLAFDEKRELQLGDSDKPALNNLGIDSVQKSMGLPRSYLPRLAAALRDEELGEELNRSLVLEINELIKTVITIHDQAIYKSDFDFLKQWHSNAQLLVFQQKLGQSDVVLPDTTKALFAELSIAIKAKNMKLASEYSKFTRLWNSEANNRYLRSFMTNSSLECLAAVTKCRLYEWHAGGGAEWFDDDEDDGGERSHFQIHPDDRKVKLLILADCYSASSSTSSDSLKTIASLQIKAAIGIDPTSSPDRYREKLTKATGFGIGDELSQLLGDTPTGEAKRTEIHRVEKSKQQMVIEMIRRNRKALSANEL